MLASLGRILVASLVMGATAVSVDRATNALLPGQGLAPQIARLTITIGCSLLILAAASWVLRIRELVDVLTLMKRAVRQSPPTDHHPSETS